MSAIDPPAWAISLMLIAMLYGIWSMIADGIRYANTASRARDVELNYLKCKQLCHDPNASIVSILGGGCVDTHHKCICADGTTPVDSP